MSAELKPQLRLEIAHVLFVDIVGYSKLLIDEQKELLQDLNCARESSRSRGRARQHAKRVRSPCEGRWSLLYFDGVNQHEGILCQRQLQLRKVLPQPKLIFFPSRGPITSSSTSATPNRQHTFTKQLLVSNRSPIPDRKRERKIERA